MNCILVLLVVFCLGWAACTPDVSARFYAFNPLERVDVSDDGLSTHHEAYASLSLERVFAFVKAFRELPYQPLPQPGAGGPIGSIPLQASYYDFIPAQVGSVPLGGGALHWQGVCFHSYSATLSANATAASLVVTAAGKSGPACQELYSFCDRESCHFKVFAVPGTHRMTFALQPYELYDLTRNGLGAYFWPLGVVGTAHSLEKTASLFTGADMVQHNVAFFAEKEFWSMQQRPVNFVNLTADHFTSGDMLTILRLDGLDPLIAWGTGGTTGHTAIYVDFPDGPHICESTDSPGGPNPYWPPPYGIIRTPLDQWMRQAIAADYHVNLVKLRKDLADRLDVSAMIQFFDKVQGMPYGWHNFIFSFFDTEWNNLPRPITPDLFEVVVGAAERYIPIDAKGSVYNFLIQGLNHRLNSNCTQMQCIYQVIDPLNMTLSAATAIPELESWRYEGNYSMVCDVFVFEMLQNGGVIDKSIQATEQTPKDVYQMNLWQTEYQRPLECIAADPNLPYCQLMGKYVLTLPGWNERDLYDNMNNQCGCIYPQYWRGPPGC